MRSRTLRGSVESPELSELRGIVDAIDRCPPEDAGTFQQLDFRFYVAMARGSENVALLLLFNSIRDIYFEFSGFFEAMFADVRQRPSLYREIFTAVQAHDEVRAAELTASLVEQTNQVLLQLAETACEASLANSHRGGSEGKDHE